MTDMCQEIQDAIALEGKAPENADSREHLSECAECARFLESVLAVEDQLRALSTFDVRDDVVDGLLARPEVTHAGRSHRLQWAMGLAAAAAIAFVAARVSLLERDRFAREPEIAVVEPQSRRALTDDERRQLGSLAYSTGGGGGGVAGEAEGKALDEDRKNELRQRGYSDRLEPTFEDAPVDALGDATKSRDKVVRREMYQEKELREQEGLAGRLAELNRDDSQRIAGAKKDLETQAAASPNRPSEPAASAAVPPPPSVSLTIVVTTETPALDVYGTPEGKASPEKTKLEHDDFRTRELSPLQSEIRVEPTKIVHVDAVYPEAAKRMRLSGTVGLRVVIAGDGNVTRAIVTESVEGLDQAAIDAVMQWKYEPSDDSERTATALIAFEPPDAPNDDARLFLEERERIEGLSFKDPRGYWANTYLPGDPRARYLAMRLRKDPHDVAPHWLARPIAQPFDAPSRGALSLTVHADRRGITGPERLLVQVGLQATESHGRRRPPMNVGIVLDAAAPEARAVIESLLEAKALGDRFRLIVPGQGELVPPESFRHGPLTVALDELTASGDLTGAVRTAIERVHAGDDPTMPLGSSLVLIVTSRKLGGDIERLTRLAHRSAVGGVPVSLVGVGEHDRGALDELALAGQGRRYFLERATDAASVVDRELAASSRVVARALRLRIKLASGVKLVDVVGSHPLNERQSERVREAEKSIDLRLARNLGIEADRGEDEDGIQVVIPSFYAGDAHTILLDVVAERPGDIAEVTVRYKDLDELRNTVTRASLTLPRTESSPGPLETNVLKNYLALRLSEELERAADELDRGEREIALARLDDELRLLSGLGLDSDRELARDVSMLSEYVSVLSSSTEPALVAYLADSLRFAGLSKRQLPAGLT